MQAICRREGGYQIQGRRDIFGFAFGDACCGRADHGVDCRTLSHVESSSLANGCVVSSIMVTEDVAGRLPVEQRRSRLTDVARKGTGIGAYGGLASESRHRSAVGHSVSQPSTSSHWHTTVGSS
jgi:hypothetical protein